MRRLALPTLLLVLLAGCADVAVRPQASTVPASDARELAQSGDHAAAAQAWREVALAERGGARDRAWLQAAEEARLAGDPERMREAWEQSNRRRLQGADTWRHDLVGAQLRLEAGQPAEALARLGQGREAVPAELRERWHGLRAAALQALGRGFEAAGELARLDARLAPAARADNARRIDRLLAAEPDERLAAAAAALPAGDPLYNFAGRALAGRGLPLPRPYDRGAGLPGLDALPPATADGYRPPERLAVLLPLSGPLAAAGTSVRDGVLAAYFAESRRRPTLRFYDTGAAGGVADAVARAQADGAQMVVGPLAREQVDALFATPGFVLPAVTLNRGSAPPPGSASFALAPEDEGVAAADRLLERGLRRVLVVTQADDAAARALAAFRARLAERGGTITAEVVVEENNPDYVPALQQAIASGGAPDALFLSLKAAQARLLSSQVEPAGLADRPRVATSLILSGANLRMDVELDGIEYPELPWLIGLRGGLPDPDTLGHRLPGAQGGGARLFAFGMDAWLLAAHLEQLLTDPGAQLRGATGELQLDAGGQVQRRPAWAVFSGGRARPAPDGALLPDAGTP